MSIKESFEEWQKNLGETRPWDMLDPSVPKVSDIMAFNRISICRECPEFIKMTTQCKKCGCIMKLKTKLEPAGCPLHKW
jgi:hypothetical protein